MKKRLMIVCAALVLTLAGLAYAVVPYSWQITGSSVKLWGSDAHDVTIDPSGVSGNHENKAFFYADHYANSSTPSRAGVATETISVPRAAIMVLRENGTTNDNASAWMESSGGAKVKACVNGDVEITLGQ